jgi:hypothetical protein
MAVRYGKCLATTPSGGGGQIPRVLWRCAPRGYATIRQLRAMGLRPGGQGVQIEIVRPRYRRHPLIAYLYRIDLALPVRPMTPAKRAALAKANTARRTCPSCKTDAGYVIPTSLGMCVPCAYPEEQRAA